MSPLSVSPRLLLVPATALLMFTVTPFASGQSTATLKGQVFDPQGAIVSGARVSVTNVETAVVRYAQTLDDGIYQIAALPVGSYRVEVKADGFQSQIIESFEVQVARTTVKDFQLSVGDITQAVTIRADGPTTERGSIEVGQVVDQRTIQMTPLNGRYFLDIALLVPGSVTPPTNSFSATPGRGVGALAINTAGNREEAVNYLINGITLNNQAFSSISFQPSISTVSEFKVDNSTFSAESGQTSGAIVNIATKSGTNLFHGEAFEFFRNDALDARNFFTFTSSEPPPFKRNQFGGNVGGPLVKDRTFFFVAYEGLRQQQSTPLNSLVLSDAERNSVTDPLIRRLVGFVPVANFIDSSRTSRFIGSAAAPINTNQWAVDISHNLGKNDRLHAYYHAHRVEIVEPNRNGNSIPGFGHTFQVQRQILTLNETHLFGSSAVNEARLGFNRIYGTAIPNAKLNPADFGIQNGVHQPIGLSQINVAGGLNFGGPANQPVGRGDTTFVASDTFSYLRGKHSLKLGGEGRQFYSNNFALDTGRFNFSSVADFISGVGNSFAVTLGDRTSSIKQSALNLFVQDRFKWRPNLTLELGLRYEWNITPTERFDRFIVFDPDSVSLLRVGTDLDDVYHQNNKNFEPRVGIAWEPGNGRLVVRAAYAILTDQPMTSIVAATTANPPLATPLAFTGPVGFENAINLAVGAGLAPTSVDHSYSNAYLQSWNFNVQSEVSPGILLFAGYIGSAGTNLVLRRNLNQPTDGVRPYPRLSTSSPILPGTSLGNITQVESTGNPSYNALWVSLNQRLRKHLQFGTYYTWSKSLDYNSLNSQGVVVQNSFNLRGDRGVSDFDARHRFVVNAIYDFPFHGSPLVDGWRIAAIVQLQSGNPVNIVTNNPTVNGVALTLRPDVTGPINTVGTVERWFDTSVFNPVPRFGNLGRNVITGPGFSNTDASLIKSTHIAETVVLEIRAEFFDLFNQANFSQPGNVVGSANFSRITSTRFPTGESGSSRQIQLAMKLSF